MIEIYLNKHCSRYFLLFFLTVCSITCANGQINLQDGLLACYAFSGNANDGSGNSNNGTVNGATLTTDRFGNANSAYNFDGATNYIEIPSTQFKNNIYTFSVWVNTATIPGTNEYTYPFSIGGGGGDQSLDLSNGANGAKGWTFGGYSIGSQTVPFCHVGSLPVVNTWYHLVGTRDNSTMKLFVNGQLISTANTNGFNPSYGIGTTAMIGARATLVQKFKGKVDDIRIYNRAITAAEVTELYTNPPDCKPPAPDLTQGLLACYPFTGNANDISGNGNNGTVSGATLITDRFGNPSSAYYFDGINDNISISPANLKIDTYTYSLWASAKSIPPNENSGRLLSVGSSGGDQDVGLSTNYINVSVGWEGSGYNGPPTTTSSASVGSLPATDTWYHLVVTRDNVNIKLYVNGQLKASSPTGSSAFYGTGVIRAIIGGRSQFIQYYNGAIDDIRIYNRAITSEEVALLYTSPPCQPSVPDLKQGLLACYPFTGNANDISGHGNNGTVNGATLTADRFGNPGSAYSFDGSNALISIPPSNFKTNSYTYSLWANARTFPSDGETFRMLSIGGPGGDQDASLSNSYVEVSKGWDGAGYNSDGTVSHYSVGSLPSVNTWYYITVTRDNADIKLYVNGKLAGSNPTNGLAPNYGYGAPKAAIGSRSTSTQLFNGLLDDIRIYDRAITADEVALLYKAPNLGSISIQASNLTPCAETEVTFTASPTIGGNAQYQWKVDDVNEGGLSASPTFSYTFLNSAQAYTAKVSVEVSSNASCGSATGQTTFTVTPSLVPAVSLTASNSNPCAGETLTFTANPTNGGTSPLYQWFIKGVKQGAPSTDATFSTSFVNDSQAYPITVSVELTSDLACAAPSKATDQTTLIVKPTPVPSVTLTADNYKPCEGAVVLFTAVPTNGGSSPLYQWKIDGVDQGALNSNATFSHTFTPAAQAYTAMVSVVMTSNADCASPTQGTAQRTVAIDPTPFPSVMVTAANSKPCAGEKVLFTATPINGGSVPLYQWSVDGVKRGSASSDSTLSIDFSHAAQSYNVIVSVEMMTACASAKHGVGQTTVTVQPLVTPTLVINVSEPTSCTNTATSFTATPSITGAMYQWKVNEVNQGVPTTLSTFSYPFPNAPSDYIIGVEASFPASSCLLPASAKKTVSVASPSLMQVALSINDQEICAGQTSAFVVHPPMAGATYQWKIDGVAQGMVSQDPTFATTFPEKAQSYDAIVSVDIIPNQRCIATATKQIKVTINPNPRITCLFPEAAENGELTRYAVQATGGLPPYHYRWTFGNDTIKLGGEDAINYAFTKSGVFTMEVYVTDSKGCEATCQSTIHSLFFPNVFTPNGDEQNDNFSIWYAENDFDMHVYNRWGKLVCHTNDGVRGWDGEGFPAGIYFYQIKIASKEYKGWVSLLR